MKNILTLILLCLLAFLFFSFRIAQVPPGINGDELGIARNAVLVSRNLTDENSNFLPLFVFAKSSADWKQPVTVYTTAAFFKIFGVSFTHLRMASILFIIASIVIFYFLAEEIFDFKFFVVGSLIFLPIPSILI